MTPRPAIASVLEPVLKGLMLEALEGDQRAYAELLKALATLLERYFDARLGASPDAVEDLVQETLLAVHEKRRTYDRDRLLTPWVFAIARHKLFNRLHRQARQAALPLEAAADQPDPLNPEAGAVRVDLDRALRQLTPKQRRMLEEIKVEGHSVADVARRHQTTEGAVKVGVHRSLRKMAGIFRDDD